MAVEQEVAHQFRHVFKCLADEESRKLFMHRLEFYLDENYNHIVELLKDVGIFDKEKCKAMGISRQYLETFLLKPNTSFDKIVLYGASGGAELTLRRLDARGIKVACVCDRDTKKQSKPFFGHKVISPEELEKNYKEYTIIVTTLSFSHQIYDVLKKMGFHESKIIFSTSCETQYFGLPFLRPVKNEVYVDVGCFDGNTVFEFIKFCGGNYNKILAFEPDEKNLEIVKNNIDSAFHPNIELIGKGAWSSEGVLNFSDSDSGQFSQINPNGTLTVPVTTIDKVVGSEVVTFIKMDIEGAELEALKGAENTIKAHKPRLAISLYHKPEDIITVPMYLNGIVPEYKFYIRHHSPDLPETVLYAVI